MTQEEKAKAYDKALQIARKINNGEGVAAPSDWTICETIFPELKESEDEKIRKWIITQLELKSDVNNPHDLELMILKSIAWLEKQASPVLSNYSNNGKVEPKFKIGDTVKDPYGDTYHIIEVGNDSYKTDDSRFILFENEDAYRLWTIEDAKDGDVLATPNYIYIFNSIDKEIEETVCYYCLLKESDKSFSFGDSNIHDEILNSVPATKEQRDLLFQKIKEAGYEWNAEKKELKKAHIIDESKAEMGYCFTKMMNGEKVSPSWSEEDEKMLNDILMCGERHCYLDAGNIAWLKSLRDRVQLQPKQEWSEEDIEMLNSAISFVEHSAFTTIGKGKNNVISWLKSFRLHKQWKPTEEQMKYLYKYSEQNNYDGTILTSLYNDLKQL